MLLKEAYIVVDTTEKEINILSADDVEAQFETTIFTNTFGAFNKTIRNNEDTTLATNYVLELYSELLTLFKVTIKSSDIYLKLLEIDEFKDYMKSNSYKSVL